MNVYNHNHTTSIEPFKPLMIFLGAISLTEINTVLATIAGGCSALYAIIKLYKELKNKKDEKEN